MLTCRKSFIGGKSSGVQEATRKVFTLVLQTSHRYMLEAGIAATDLLEDTGLDESDIVNPYQVIDAGQAKRYYENVVRLAPTPAVGLEIGRISNLMNIGTFGMMALASRTPTQSAELTRRNYDIFYMHLKWLTRLGRGSIIHNFVSDEPPGLLRIFLIERAMATLHRHAVQQLGEICQPSFVGVDYPAPDYADVYRDIFGDVVEFDQPAVEIRYPKRLAQLPLRTSSPDVRDSLAALCEDLLQRLHSDSSFIADLRFVISEQPGVFLKISDAAARIGMSPRNLRRKLAKEGTNYRQIVDDLRCNIATGSLAGSDLSIQEVAHLCGFNSPQNFANAFKRWTGHSPTRYRQLAASDKR